MKIYKNKGKKDLGGVFFLGSKEMGFYIMVWHLFLLVFQ
jgi:hypothetical protein